MLSERALIIHLKISQWTARKHDKTVSKEVEEQKEANNAGRYNKLLIAKDKIGKIEKVAAKIRDFHYKNTLPWGDNGERLLPSENYFNYMSKLQELKKEFDQNVETFINEYPLMIDEAKKRLGQMFCSLDYPSSQKVMNKFGVKTTLLPVQEIDFRVSIGEEEIEKLKQDAVIEMHSRLQEAQNNLWERIREQLFHMEERLSDPDAIFKNSLFDNLSSLIEMLPRLNVNKEEDISKITEDMKELLHSPDDVRKNSLLRKSVVNKIQNIKNTYLNYGNNARGIY